MTQTPISLVESAKKIFHERDVRRLDSSNQTFFASGGRKDCNTHQSARIGEKKVLMNSTCIMSRKWESSVFGLRRSK